MVHSMNRKTDDSEKDYTEVRSVNCIDHENRLTELEKDVKTIDKRQHTIYTSMYGVNGNPKEGYVWKLEQVLDWASTIKNKWGIIEKVALTGAVYAIALVGFQIIKILIEHGTI